MAAFGGVGVFSVPILCPGSCLNRIKYLAKSTRISVHAANNIRHYLPIPDQGYSRTASKHLPALRPGVE